MKDGNLDAVTLFLQIGINPDAKDSIGAPVLMSAVTMCTTEPAGARIEILKALLAAKAVVDPKDDNGSTPLLWSVTAQCPTDFARALLAAGANPNVKAKGGGTPLMLAKVFQRADLIALLEKSLARSSQGTRHGIGNMPEEVSRKVRKNQRNVIAPTLHRI